MEKFKDLEPGLSHISLKPENRKADLQELELQAKATLQGLYSSSGKYLWASDDINFKYAFFGRDTAQVVDNLSQRQEYHDSSCKLLISLAEHQGLTTNNITEERRGAIPHEIRAEIMDGEAVDENARRIFHMLRAKWWNNANADTITYYGELEGSARFVRACSALARNGVDLDKQTFRHMSGQERSLLDACDWAIQYYIDRMDKSELGLVELQPPLNPDTLFNQTLKDSVPAYLHKRNGSPLLPNRYAPRAPLEAQLQAYEAFLDYAQVIAMSDPAKSDTLCGLATGLKQRILANFFVPPDARSFQWPYPYLSAMLDRNPDSGKVRKLNTLMPDAFEGLKGHFFAGNDEASRQLREGVIQTGFSEDFLTNCGIRSRGQRDRALYSYAEYHGAMTNWIVNTHNFATGLHQHGTPRLAQEIWTRMICGLIVSGSLGEFIYTDNNGHMLSKEEPENPATIVLHAEEHAQHNQAWSISAVLEALSYLQRYDFENIPTSNYNRNFEDRILAAIPQYRNQPHELLATIRKTRVRYELQKPKHITGEPQTVPSPRNSKKFSPLIRKLGATADHM